MQAEGDKAAAGPLIVEGQVLVNQVDPLAEPQEADSVLLEFPQPPQAVDSGAVDQHVLGHDRVPAVELSALEGVVPLPRDGRGFGLRLAHRRSPLDTKFGSNQYTQSKIFNLCLEDERANSSYRVHAA